MKRCPSCQSQYTDPTLSFCLHDGTPLVDASMSSEQTFVLGEQETIVSLRNPNPQPASPYPPNNFTNPLTQNAFPQASPPSKSFFPVILILLLLFLVISVAAIGFFIYLQKGASLANSNLLPTNNNTSDNSSVISNVNTPVNSGKKSDTNKKTDVQITPIDKEKIKEEVSDRLENWKSDAELLNLDSYMSNYAETVDYYNKSGASRDFVRRDKAKAFSKYDSIEINLSNLIVKPAPDGQSATVILDKEWSFSNLDGETSSGKVRQQISLKKFGDKWLITGEKDLQVYFIER